MIPRWLTGRFDRRLMLLMLLATIPMMLGGNWILSREIARHLTAKENEELASSADHLGNTINSWVQDVAGLLQLLSRHPDLVSMDSQRQRALLLQLPKVNPHVTYSHVIGPDGMDLARGDNKRPINFYDRNYFRQAMAGTPVVRETLLRSRSTGHPGLDQAAPIRDPAGKILGVLVLGMDYSVLCDIVGAARYGHSGYSCLVDDQGRALAHPDPECMSKLRDLRSLPPVQGVIRDRVSRPYRFRDEKGAWWLAYAVALPNHWSVVSLVQEAEVLAEMHHIRVLVLLVTGIVAVVMTALIGLVAKKMVQPILRMTATAVAIGNGDVKQRISEERQGELGALARAFNKMVGQLEGSYRRAVNQNALLRAINQLFEKTLACEGDAELAGICLALAKELTGSKFGLIGERNQSGHLDAITLDDPEKHAGRIAAVDAIRIMHNMDHCGVLREAIDGGESFIINDPDSHSNRVGLPDGHPQLTSLLGVPLKSGEKTFGAIVVANKEGGYDTSDREAIESLSAAFVAALVRKRAEANVRKSEARLSDAMHRAHMASWDWNLATNEVCGSEQLYHIYGFARTEATMPFEVLWERMPPDDRPAVRKFMDDAKNDPTNGEHFVEHRVVRPDGEVRHVYAQVVVSRDAKGTPLALVGTIIDVTERKRAEEALRKKEEEFRQAQKLEAVGALAGGVAHEFNNLLQAIRAFTQFALKDLSPEEQRYQDLQEVLKASERATNLTRQLLGFSRRQQFQSASVRLNEILTDLERMLRTLIGENIELEMSLGEGLGLLQVDPTMIQQVVMNLCINARDAMLSGGRLLIKTENITIAQGDDASAVHGRPGRYVRLTVSDTGSGIPAEVLERIFEPFFTTKDIGKGTGLGLSMVYGVVKQHGGMIRVRSAAGQGATFEIDLPTADVASQAAEPTSLHSAFGGTETILVAEDDPLVRAAVVRVLTEAGYAVLSASDGEEAVRVFAEHSTAIALVLLDMIMPIMGGREAHRQIAEINPDTPVVYCTGYDSGLESLDAAEVARLWVLTKPVAPETLLNTLREVLDKGSPCLTS